MFTIVFTEKAELEYNVAFWYYEEMQEGLGVTFEYETENLLKIIEKNPLLFQRKYKRYREALLRKFPYFIVYEIVNSKIIIHSLFHTSRNPKKKYK